MDTVINTDKMRQEATKCNSEHDNSENATNCLLAYVKENKELREYVLWYGCNRLIHDDRHKARSSPPSNVRATNANTTTTIPRSGKAAQLEVASIYTESYLDSYFIGNKRLGDCVKSDVVEQIGLHRGKINGFQHEVSFLTTIAKKLKNNRTTVRKVWTPKEVKKLRDG